MLKFIDDAVKNGKILQANTEHLQGAFLQIKALLDTISILKRKVYTLEKKIAQLQHCAYHDDLTGLPNRSLFHDRVNQAVKHAARNHTKMSLLLLDLNGFKIINDTFGHEFGDKVLRFISNRLLSGIRAEDSVYRYGGDEFIVLLPEVDGSNGSTELIRKLQRHLSEPFILGDHLVAISASIGQAVFPDDGATLSELVSQADTEMYIAKTNSQSVQSNLLS